MKRILCIVGSMDIGGAETFLMKIYEKLDKEKYQMDFCVASEKTGFYDEKILKYGGKIFRVTPKTKSFFKNFIDIKNIVKNNKYSNVLRISQNSLSALELFASKLGGAKNLMFRSSNSNTCGGKIETIIHYMFRPIANLISNVKLAPSIEAAQFMFGNRICKNKQVYIMKNAIDVSKFEFNVDKRNNKRKELGIDNNVVIGHIGRFSEQKNHKYLLECFANAVKINKKLILILIGNGELENEIKDYTLKLKINEYVKFLGIRSDISEILMAMDMFVFPSLFEGLPNTIIEAQATGLKCLVSDNVTKEAKLLDSTEYFSISSENKNKWSDAIKKAHIDNVRITDRDVFQKAGYDLNFSISDYIKILYGEG